MPQPVVSTSTPQVAIGTTATLNCTTSVSGVSYQWTKNGVTLTDSGTINGSAQSTLVITNVGAGDQGAYVCQISVGGANSTSNPVNLTTLGMCVC